MIKIALVVPYKGFIDIAFDVFQEHNEYFSKGYFGGQEYEITEYVAIDEEIKELGLDADVIMARGKTAEYTKIELQVIPTVEIPVAGLDLLEALFECKNRFPDHKVGVIGSRNMLLGASHVAEHLGLDSEVYILEHHWEGPVLVERAARDGCQVVIAGMGGCAHTEKLGLDYLFLRTSKASFWQALTEAKRVALISRKEQEKAQLYQTILDHAYEGVIAFDNQHMITVFNSAAEKILGIPKDRAIEKSLEQVDKLRAHPNLLTDEVFYDKIVSFNNNQLAMNKVLNIVKGKTVGSVLTFQDVTGIQEKEQNIRKKIYLRGHVAKFSFDKIIGCSPEIKTTIEIAQKYSEVGFNILLVGETGTGKELFAQSIHNYSPRSKGPFVAVNCAALPENLLESELFGYVEGAFTGAAKTGKPGFFELAHGGTIFLDEIGELSLPLQGRLLRVLQEKEIVRLGDDRVIPIDVRILSATNKSLNSLVEVGTFREDLFYRLNVLKLDLPPLRFRKQDIPLLIEHFIRIYSETLGMPSIHVDPAAMEKLTAYEWPGNVRQLENMCKRLMVLSENGVISERDVTAALSGPVNSPPINSTMPSYQDDIKTLEIKRILAALEQHGFNRQKASEFLGISTTTLWRRMKEYNLI